MIRKTGLACTLRRRLCTFVNVDGREGGKGETETERERE
jgi:hypothetical protein